MKLKVVGIGLEGHIYTATVETDDLVGVVKLHSWAHLKVNGDKAQATEIQAGDTIKISTHGVRSIDLVEKLHASFAAHCEGYC